MRTDGLTNTYHVRLERRGDFGGVVVGWRITQGISPDLAGALAMYEANKSNGCLDATWVVKEVILQDKVPPV